MHEQRLRYDSGRRPGACVPSKIFAPVRETFIGGTNIFVCTSGLHFRSATRTTLLLAFRRSPADMAPPSRGTTRVLLAHDRDSSAAKVGTRRKFRTVSTARQRRSNGSARIDPVEFQSVAKNKKKPKTLCLAYEKNEKIPHASPHASRTTREYYN